MIHQPIESDARRRPGLLVSVRSAEEALAALAGGADVIDVKEPRHGALGAADSATIAAVVQAVRGRASVTAALGELTARAACPRELPFKLAMFKLGLAGCRALADWQARWREAISAAAPIHPVAVVYADWRLADAPPPEEVLAAAMEAGAPALLIDTWCKTAGSLFDHWPAPQLEPFLHAVRAQGLLAVLAGSLMHGAFAAAVDMAPDLVAVRTAACHGDRGGTVSMHCVRALKQAIRHAPSSPVCHHDSSVAHGSPPIDAATFFP